MNPDELYKSIVDSYMRASLDKDPDGLRKFVRAILQNEESLTGEHLRRALVLIDRVLN